VLRKPDIFKSYRQGSYAGKKAALAAAGVTVCATPSGVPAALRERMDGL
jgi:hypothetical protein